MIHRPVCLVFSVDFTSSFVFYTPANVFILTEPACVPSAGLVLHWPHVGEDGGVLHCSNGSS